jgi:hypothetical protein
LHENDIGHITICHEFYQIAEAHDAFSSEGGAQKKHHDLSSKEVVGDYEHELDHKRNGQATDEEFSPAVDVRNPRNENDSCDDTYKEPETE